MANSKAPALVRKPRPDFPLFPHATGRWAKKVRGKMCYFGKTADDPKGTAALLLWEKRREDLYAGRKPRDGQGDEFTLAKLCNLFLDAKLSKLEAKDLSERTFSEYNRICDLLIADFGRDRPVTDLKPADFQTLYSKLAAKHSIVSLGREVTMVRSVFKFAADPENDLLDRPVKFGSSFKAPSKKRKRIARGLRRREQGHKMFSAAEIASMLASATPQLKAMILLGVNGGLGNTDCSSLTRKLLDMDAGWLDFPRPKTGVDRRIPLWPETVQALREVLDHPKRPKAKQRSDSDLVFLTRLGQPWVRYDLTQTKDEEGRLKFDGKAADAIATAMSKLLRELGITRTGCGFYALRHTFETIAGGAKDQIAVNCIMGHADESMAAEYRELIHNGEERLRTVVDFVREWLFGKRKSGSASSDQMQARVSGKKKVKRQSPASAAKRRASAELQHEYFPLRIVG